MVINGAYFKIEKVDENDIDEILEVYKQCEDFLALGPIPHASKQMILEDFKISKEEGGIFCGVFVDSRMIGIVDFVLSNFEGNYSDAFISLLMISKVERGKGIGRDIIAAVETEIQKNNSIKNILAAVQTNNHRAVKLWKSMGYIIESGPELQLDNTIIFRLRKEIVK